MGVSKGERVNVRREKMRGKESEGGRDEVEEKSEMRVEEDKRVE